MDHPTEPNACDRLTQGAIGAADATFRTRLDAPQTAEGRPLAAVQPAWLTYKDAEVYTSLSRVTLWRLLAESKIEAARIGRAVRISRASLDEYLAGQRFDASA